MNRPDKILSKGQQVALKVDFEPASCFSDNDCPPENMTKERLFDPVSPNFILKCFSNCCDDPGSNRTILPPLMRGPQRYILRGELASNGRIDDQPASSCDLPWIREVGNEPHHKDGDHTVLVINQRN